ncbi:FecCD family ABC transporter permease [Nocardia sp. NPDC059240]|uniref:FecCD family ABC transporter permease n=1 Tax=Nocardia sp. NPDC059240 TaxID=3346786 RepID=UPI0036C8008F
MTDPQAPQPDPPTPDTTSAATNSPSTVRAANSPTGNGTTAVTAATSRAHPSESPATGREEAGDTVVEVSEAELESAAAQHFPASVDPAPLARRTRSRTTLIFAGALAGLVVLALISAAIGQVPTSYAEVAGSVFHRMGLDWGPMPHHPAGYVTLWEVRFPRVVLAVLVGAALATAGALLQGVFANPLAEPGVIGVSAGAAVGAGTVIVIGGAFAAAWSVAAGAFVAGLGTTALVYLLSRSGGRTEVVTLILTGVAINAFAGGLISFLLFKASPAARDQLVFWQMGSLNGATWQAVNVVWPLTLLGVAAAIWMAPRLDLLALGESAARHLGVDVERLRRNIIVVVAILATAGVAFTGIILFVGLIVPHLVRMLVGPGHRVLIPLSAILGAAVLVAADIGARALVHNADLPLGMITSLVGGPFFFWLLRRTRSRAGGWA